MALVPSFTFTRSSEQLISLFILPVNTIKVLPQSVPEERLAYPSFSELFYRYKKSVFERHYWAGYYSSLTNQSNHMINKYRTSVVDTHRNDRWVIAKWHIQFLFSERLLVAIKHRSNLPNWYEDIDVAIEYMAQLAICFNSINAFYETFGSLPMIGDRLFNEDTGLIIKDRCIDGGLRTITFVLSE
jgi:hypothetical protein